MPQPIAEGDGFAGKIYITGTADDRSAHSLDVFVQAVDTQGTNNGSATITWDNLEGVSASAGTDGVSFTII